MGLGAYKLKMPAPEPSPNVGFFELPGEILKLVVHQPDLRPTLKQTPDREHGREKPAYIPGPKVSSYMCVI